MLSHHFSRFETIKTGEITISDVPHSLQFWLLLCFTIPSLICSFYIIYRYLSSRTNRQAIHNHSVLLIIIINVLIIFTDVSWMLDNHRQLGHVWMPTPAFCLIWWILDDSLYGIQTSILAWASIERHILIFHNRFMGTLRQRILYHFIPPIFIILYYFSFYIGVIIFAPCQNEYNFDQIQCGSDPCFSDIEFVSIWDSVFNSIVPTLTIAIFNISLFYRIIAQKQRLNQPIQWRKHRRMSMQLLSLSGVYLFLNLPMIIILLVKTIQKEDPETSFGTQLIVFLLTYAVTLSLPFVVCLNRLTIDRDQRTRIFPTISYIRYRKNLVHEAATIG